MIILLVASDRATASIRLAPQEGVILLFTWDSSAVTWDTMPSVTNTGQVVNTGAHGYSSACPAAHSHWDIDGIVQAWADGAANYGLQLSAVDETDSLSWRRYYSANYTGDSDDVPHLTVTYEDTDVAGLKDSASLSTPVVSSGTVTNAAGTPVTDADVVLYAWPDNDSENALQEGDTVELQPVAKAVSDSSGNYALRIGDVSSLAPQAGSDSLVNFETVAYSGTTQANFSFPRRLISATNSSTGSAYLTAVTPDSSSGSSSLAADSSAPDAGFTTSTAAVTANLALESLSAGTDAADSTAGRTDDTDNPASLTDDPTAAAPDSSADYDAGVTKGCSAQLVKNYGPKWVIVGQTYSVTSGVDHTLTYSSGASSTLGVAISGSGAIGSFKASGSSSKSSTITNFYPTYGNHRGVYYQTQFKYGKYHVMCAYGKYNNKEYYEARTTGFVGGENVAGAGAPRAAYCTRYLNGAKFTKKNSKAITWTDGASLKGSIGIDLSARTGYTTDATVKYTFHADRYVCGTNDYPGADHVYNFLAASSSSEYRP